TRSHRAREADRGALRWPAHPSLRPRTAARARARGPRDGPPSGSGDVLAGTRVDLEPIADVHEERYLEHEAGLERGGLAGARPAVALDARLGLAHRELDGGGQFDADDLAVVHRQFDC